MTLSELKEIIITNNLNKLFSLDPATLPTETLNDWLNAKAAIQNIYSKVIPASGMTTDLMTYYDAFRGCVHKCRVTLYNDIERKKYGVQSTDQTKVLEWVARFPTYKNLEDLNRYLVGEAQPYHDLDTPL